MGVMLFFSRACAAHKRRARGRGFAPKKKPESKQVSRRLRRLPGRRDYRVRATDRTGTTLHKLGGQVLEARRGPHDRRLGVGRVAARAARADEDGVDVERVVPEHVRERRHELQLEVARRAARARRRGRRAVGRGPERRRAVGVADDLVRAPREAAREPVVRARGLVAVAAAGSIESASTESASTAAAWVRHTHHARASPAHGGQPKTCNARARPSTGAEICATSGSGAAQAPHVGAGRFRPSR